MSTNNYIVTADLSFDNHVMAVENIDGDRFAVGGSFTQVTDSTGEVKDCLCCGIFNKEGELLVPINVIIPAGVGLDVEALAYLGNDKLAIGGHFTQVNRGPLGGGELVDTSHCAIFTTTDGTLDVSFGDISGNGIFHTVEALAYLENDKLAVGGNFSKVNKGPQAGGASVDTSHCAIFNTTNGELDVSFGNISGNGTFPPVMSLAYLENNKLAVGGAFSKVNKGPQAGGASVDTSSCAIFNTTNGELDVSFGSPNVTGQKVFALEYLGNNKLAVGGNFTNFNKGPQAGGGSIGTTRLAIFDTSQGELDVSFNISIGNILSLDYLESGQLALGGNSNFNQIAEGPQAGGSLVDTTSLAIVNPSDGSLIKSFRNILSNVIGITDLSNNHLVVGGALTNMHNDCPGATNGTPCNNLAILYNAQTILEPTTQEVTESVDHIPSIVPNAERPFFGICYPDAQAARRAEGNNVELVSGTLPNGRPCVYVKNQNYCVNLTKGLNANAIDKRQ